MEPEAGNPHEVEGILNPAAARGPDGHLYLFPRLVAKGNYSRIGIARVKFNAAGDPTAVERLGIALEPEAEYERRPDGGGGCEDPRISFVEPLQRYIMTYTAYSPRSTDRSGLLNRLIPLATPGACNLRSVSRHRPRRHGRQGRQPVSRRNPEPAGSSGTRSSPPATVSRDTPRGNSLLACVAHVRSRPGKHLDFLQPNGTWSRSGGFGQFTSHHRLATPVSPWERLKIGAGTPPILTHHGWLIIYHGVRDMAEPDGAAHPLCYSAGVMVLSEKHPRVILYRSEEPVLKPELPQERSGTIANVVFPTGIDRRDDLACPDRFDVYYGMADSRIGVARLDMPEILPAGGAADPPEAKV